MAQAGGSQVVIEEFLIKKNLSTRAENWGFPL